MKQEGKIRVGVDSLGRARWTRDEHGKRYGRLLVVRLHAKRKPPRGGSVAWRCICDCGNKVVVGGAQLRIGQTKSCGCYRIDRISESHRLPNGEAAFNRAIGKIIGGARRRNLFWGLTKEQSRKLMTSSCHYCGVAPYRISAGKYGTFVWNGIDQLIPCGGYTPDNCVPCCTPCNQFKSASDYVKFIDRCVRIALFRLASEGLIQKAQVKRLITKRALLYDDIEPLAKQAEGMKKAR